MRAKYLGEGNRREPEEISSVLGTILERTSTDVDVRHGDLIARWASVAPGDWALGTPVGVRDGVLLVTVPDGATASRLGFQHRALLEAVEQSHGADLIHAVRVRVERARPAETPDG